MPVYLITVHTYRSWSEDNPRGYVQRGERGVRRPNPELAAYRRSIAKGSPVRLDPAQQRVVLDALHEISVNLGCQPYAASCTPTHWHLLVGWVEQVPHVNRVPHVNAGPGGTTGADGPGLTSGAQAPDVRARELATRLKRIVGMKLSKSRGATGCKWFSRGWDLTRVEDQTHFNHLVESYLPRHRQEGGLFEAWPVKKKD